MIIVVLLGLINHKPKTAVQGAGWSDRLSYWLHVLQFYLYKCVHVSVYFQWLEIKSLLNHIFIFCAHL